MRELPLSGCSVKAGEPLTYTPNLLLLCSLQLTTRSATTTTTAFVTASTIITTAAAAIIIITSHHHLHHHQRSPSDLPCVCRPNVSLSDGLLQAAALRTALAWQEGASGHISNHDTIRVGEAAEH